MYRRFGYKNLRKYTNDSEQGQEHCAFYCQKKIPLVFYTQATVSMDTWKLHFKKGKESLAKHCPRNALRELQIALEQCPTKENSSLAKIMFYIGITLKKLGAPNGAVKSWVVAQKLNKTGYSAKMLKRFVNEYGMTK